MQRSGTVGPYLDGSQFIYEGWSVRIEGGDRVKDSERIREQCESIKRMVSGYGKINRAPRRTWKLQQIHLVHLQDISYLHQPRIQ